MQFETNGNFQGAVTLVHAPTDSSAIELFDFLESHDYGWRGRGKTMSNTSWNTYKENTIYLIYPNKDITFANTGFMSHMNGNYLDVDLFLEKYRVNFTSIMEELDKKIEAMEKRILS